VSETESQRWPIWIRIIFIKETGAIGKGCEDIISNRVKSAFSTPEEFLMGYDQKPYDVTHHKLDNKYWLCIWIEVLCWLFREFTPQLMMRQY
jgi:hypothetical protein